MIDRTSAEAARAVFDEAVPDPAARGRLQRLMAATIRAAHAEGSRTWTVTLKRRMVRCNVGSAVALDVKTYGPSHVLLDMRQVPGSLAEALARDGEHEGNPARFPDLDWWRIPADWIAEHDDELRPGLVAATKAVAARTRKTQFARAWSPGVVEYLAAALNEQLPFADHPLPETDGADDEGEGEGLDVDELVAAFVRSYWDTGEAQDRLRQAERAAEVFRTNLERIRARREAGDDVTDLVLDLLVAHDPRTAASGEWSHPAALPIGNVRRAFEQAGLPAAGDWPRTAAALLDLFVAIDDRGEEALEAACRAADRPELRGFHGLLLGPSLAALGYGSVGGAIYDLDTRDFMRAMTGESLAIDLAAYPATIAEITDLASGLAATFDEHEALADAPLHDVFALFCHWYATVHVLDVEHPPGIEYWKISPDAQAKRWVECRDGGYIVIGWPALGNMLLLGDDPNEAAETTPYKFGPGQGSKLASFARMPIGSWIVANKGKSAVLGIGRVTGRYEHHAELDDFNNRLPVEWIDVTPRLVKEKGWMATLAPLSQEKFEEILAAPELDGVSDPPAFTEATFDLLERLHREPTMDVYNANKAELLKHVQVPVKTIMGEIADEIPVAAQPVMERKKRIWSKFPKNDYGHGGAHDNYWAAFFPSKQKKTNSPHLMLWVGHDHIEIGFVTQFKEGAQDERLRSRIVERADELEKWIEEQAEGIPLRFGTRTEGFVEADLGEWLRNPTTGLAVLHVRSREEAAGLSVSEVVDLGARLFRALVPLFVLAAEDEPDSIVDAILHDGDPPIIDPDPKVRFTLDDADADLFMDREDIQRLVQLIHRRRNVILQGPPGTGKTFAARRLAQVVAGRKGTDHVEMVQFHPSYSYEEFVQGLRPGSEPGVFELRDGAFHRFCQLAKQRPGEPHVFIIDEINRGNLGRILGELMVLIEPDKRGREHAMRLAYARPNDPRFFVPQNVHVIGLMNTADRSLAVVDYALRRRFAFTTLLPEFKAKKFSQHLSTRGCPSKTIDRVVQRLDELNRAIRKSKMLGDGFEIGHSFFTVAKDAEIDDWDRWWHEIVAYEVGPLLDEYSFDRRSEAKKLRTILTGEGSTHAAASPADQATPAEPIGAAEHAESAGSAAP